MKSFAGPWRPDGNDSKPADCTCLDWYLDYEANQFSDTGVDVIDWHANDCCYWSSRIAREDWGEYLNLI